MRAYSDREEAGAILAGLLQLAIDEDIGHDDDGDVIVLGLPRGGVLVAAPIAATFQVPLDVIVVRKLGVPGHEELAMGAIGPGGVQVLDHELIDRIGVPDRLIAQVVEREQRELARREQTYRRGLAPLDLKGKVAIVVDDGLATGSTMRAAVLTVQTYDVAATVVAVPVGAPSTCAALRELADEVVCTHMPPAFTAVGTWYDDFHAVSDDEVLRTLAAASSAGGARS